jgi:hypothetical protein
MTINVRFFLTCICIFFSSLLHSDNNIENNLHGYWSCSNYSELEDYNILEIYNLKFEHKKSYQNGIMHFVNLDEEAIVKYNFINDFIVDENDLVFKNTKVLNHSIDNVVFDDKYKVSDIFRDISSDVQVAYKIELITNNELVYKSKDIDFEWLSIESKCQKVNDEKDLPVF